MAAGVVLGSMGLGTTTYAGTAENNPEPCVAGPGGFIAAFRGLAKFELGQSFEAWLMGIARHRVLGHFRAVGRRHRTNEKFREECLARIGNELDGIQQDTGNESLKRLMGCVEKLPERMRQVIRARLRGEDGTKTAALLHTTRGAIYMLQLRANSQLKDCMMKGTP